MDICRFDLEKHQTKEWLLWWGRLRKGVRDVRTKHKKVFGRSNRIEESCGHLLDTVCVGFCENKNLT